MLILYILFVNFLVHGSICLFAIRFRILPIIQIAMHLFFILLVNKTILSIESLRHLT